MTGDVLHWLGVSVAAVYPYAALAAPCIAGVLGLCVIADCRWFVSLQYRDRRLLGCSDH